jgi:hypothetical protein
VVVALADDIGTCFDQESDDVQICSFRGEMQGVPQVGCYLGYTSRNGNAVAKAAQEPRQS